jgi:GT2 family glycosyltransferase
MAETTGSIAVSVGIVNRNGQTYLARTLEAVSQLGATVDEVLLIDNGSTDGGVALVRERFPQVRVIELGDNRGPGAARNAAVRQARHDRLLLIDNDAEPQPGCVEALAAALDAYPDAIVAMAAILPADAPDTVQYLGAEPHFLGTPALLYAGSPLALLDSPVRVVGTAITCCVLVDRARFGGRPWFDERMFIYLDDHEFGLRASLQGFDCLIAPAARCRHGLGTVGVSIRQTGRFTPIRVRYTMRNRWLTMLMLYQKRTLVRFAPALAAFEVSQFLGAVGKGWLLHWLWAVGSTVRSLPHVRRQRLALRQQRRRADLDVLVGGPFPYNPAMHRSALARAAQRALDAIAQLNWRLAGGRKSP